MSDSVTITAMICFTICVLAIVGSIGNKKK